MINNKITIVDYSICVILFVAPPTYSFFKLYGDFTFGSLLFIFSFLYYFFKSGKFRGIALSWPLLIWLALTVYHLANGFYKKVPDVDALDILHGFRIYSCIAIVAYWGSIDFEKSIKMLLNSFLLRCLTCLTLTMVLGMSNLDSGRLTGFGGSATLVGQAAAITGVFIVYLNALKRCSISHNILMLTLPLILVFLTQSRNSLIMMLISIFTLSIIYINRNKAHISTFKSFIAIFTIISLLYVGYDVFLQSSFGQRVVAVSQDTLNSSNYAFYSTGTIFDVIVGDRIIYYVLGWNLFLDNPFTGIGMWNYMHKVRGDYPLHSEYMVHLCEGGLIAFSLWLSFVSYVIYIIFRYNKSVIMKYSAISSIAVLLFCALYAREFFYDWFYPVYGLALAPFYYKKRKIVIANSN